MRPSVFCFGVLFALATGLCVYAIAVPTASDLVGGSPAAPALLDAELELALLQAGEFSLFETCGACFVSVDETCRRKPTGTPCGHDPSSCSCMLCQGFFDCHTLF